MGMTSEIVGGSVVEDERSPDFSGMTSEEIGQYIFDKKNGNGSSSHRLIVEADVKTVPRAGLAEEVPGEFIRIT